MRQRRLRERRRRGTRVIHVEIDDDLIAAFDELGFVDLSEKDAVGAVSFAFSMLLAEAIEARRGRFNLNSLRVTGCPETAVESGLVEKRSRK